MIYPTRRAVLLTAAGAPVALALGLVAPGLWLLGAAWAVFAAGLMLVDAMLAAGSRSAEVTAESPAVLGAGATGEARFHIAFTGRRAPPRIEVSLQAGERLAIAPHRGSLDVREGTAAFKVALTPLRRGEAALETLWVRWAGPLGLVWKQRATPLDRVIRITPDVQGVKDEAIRMFSRDAQFGMRSQLERGEGSEFQALREFQTGMDTRTIDWKASAKRRTLLGKEFRTERNHPMIFALDAGRLMSEPIDGLPRLDHALNGALLLAYVGLKAGDRVGLYSFDAKPRMATGALSGVQSFALLQRMAARIDYSAEETNFTLGLTQLAADLERRSLIVVFTDFADSTSAELMIENLGRLLKRHLVMFVVLRDEELEGLIDAEPEVSEDVSRAVIAEALAREREVVIARLRRMGVQIVHASARKVGAELLSRYLDLKRRELV